MGLRLTEGIDPARFARQTGMVLDEAIDEARLLRLTEAGFVVRDTHLRATAEGRRVLNSVIAELAA